MSARPSLRAAVNRMCRECVYDSGEPGTWIDQVARCCGYACPLYPVRPGADRLPERPTGGQKTPLMAKSEVTTP